MVIMPHHQTVDADGESMMVTSRKMPAETLMAPKLEPRLLPSGERAKPKDSKVVCGESTSTNSIASIFAWTGGLRHRAKLDDNGPLMEFAETLERVVVETVESGHMTKDLALLVWPDQKWLTSTGFLDRVDANLQAALA